MTEKEMLELLLLSVVIIPNMDRREYDIHEAIKRQMELFEKAAKPYVYGEEVEPITSD